MTRLATPLPAVLRSGGPLLTAPLVAPTDGQLLAADGVAGVLKWQAKQPLYIQVALSGNTKAITAGTKKGLFRSPRTGTITAFVVDCDPANKPSASSVQVDLNKINRTTAVATSVLSAVATIAIAGTTGTGIINGTQSVSAGDLLSIDIDQGSDGKELTATITITPTA